MKINILVYCIMDKSFPYIDTEITNDEVINQFNKLRELKFNTSKPITMAIQGNKIIHKFFDRQHAKLKRKGISYIDIWNTNKPQIKRAYASLKYPMPYTPKLLHAII